MKNPRQFEDFTIDKLEILEIFFYKNIVKVNTLMYIKDAANGKPTCFDIEKERIFEFVSSAEKWRKNLEFNGRVNKMDTYSIEGIIPGNNELSLEDRIALARAGDIISFMIAPLVIKNIVLNLNTYETSDNNLNMTIIEFYTK